MEIRQTSALLPIQTGSKDLSDLLEQLHPGQNIGAVVETRLAANNFLLRLNDSGQLIRARTEVELYLGQLLKLEMVKGGATPQLKIIQAAPVASPELMAIQQTLRHYLPKQQALADLVPLLQRSGQPAAGNDTANLPASVRSLVKSVLDALPQKKTLFSADGLRQAIKHSGVFLEAQLASPTSSLQDLARLDLKGRLLALNQALSALASSDYGDASPLSDARGGAAASAGNPGGETQPPLPGRVSNPGTVDTSALTLETQDSEASAGSATNGAEPSSYYADLQQPGASPQSRLAQDPGAAGGKSMPPQSTGDPAVAQSTADEAASEEMVSATDGADDTSAEAGSSGSKASAQGAPRFTALESSKMARDMAGSTGASGEPKTASTQGYGPDTPVSLRSAAPSATGQPRPEEPGNRDRTTLPPLAEAPESTASLKSLQQHAEGALARIVLDQLASQPQADGKLLVWQMEIPFTGDTESGSVKLKIEREAAPTTASGQRQWLVILELTPPGLGTIHSRIALCGERIDTCFWTTLDSTTALLQGNLDRLAARMRQAGIQTGQIHTLPGAPPANSPSSAPFSKLVDERA